MERFNRIVGSKIFFIITLVLFGLQAGWVAFTAAYSMAFDEYFHFGIIKLYSGHLLPLLNQQPSGPAFYGAVAHDPSFLFHYLMSFPYRLIALFTNNVPTQVVWLRCIDIALFMIGMILFKKALRCAGISNVLSNTVFVFFILLPVVPMLAGQVNYDNLVFLVTAASVYLATRFQRDLQNGWRPSATYLLLFLTLLIAGTLVKYAFLPIAAAISIYLFIVWKRHLGVRLKDIPPQILRGLRPLLMRKSGLMALLLLLVVGTMGIQRYGLNTIQFGSPIPECNQVIGMKSCQAYEPFARNVSYKGRNLNAYRTTVDRVRFPLTWLRISILSTMFALGPRYAYYARVNPLPIAYMTVWTVAVAGCIVTIWQAKAIWSTYKYLRLFYVVSIAYIAILFAQNVAEFMNLGVPVAIQGRYLIPIFIPAMVIMAISAIRLFGRWIRPRVFAAIAIVLVLFMLQGGGIVPYMLGSADWWMWDSPAVIRGTGMAQHIVRLLVFHL